MNKKKIISVLIALLGMTIIGFSIITFLGVFKKQKAGILVEANIESIVFINGQQVGKTPYESEGNEGEISLRINPNQSSDKLDDYETKLNLVSGIKTIIRKDFSENEELSSLSVLSFEKTVGDDSYVTVVSNPDKAQILIDGKIYGYAPIKVSVSAGDHSLGINSDGYLEKTLPIKVYKGYKLTALVKLSKIEQEDVQNTEINKTKDVKQIRIDKNDVGFLRVRSGASTGFPEVGQVKPDEVYDIVEEGEHGSWFKIKFGEIEGWVSGDFVTKINP